MKNVGYFAVGLVALMGMHWESIDATPPRTSSASRTVDRPVSLTDATTKAPKPPAKLNRAETRVEIDPMMESPVAVTDRLPSVDREYAPRTAEPRLATENTFVTDLYAPQTDNFYQGEGAIERVDQLRATKDAARIREDFLAERAQQAETPAVQEAVASILPSNIGQYRTTAKPRETVEENTTEAFNSRKRMKALEAVETARAKKDALARYEPLDADSLQLVDRLRQIDNTTNALGSKKTARKNRYLTLLKPVDPATGKRTGILPKNTLKSIKAHADLSPVHTGEVTN